MIKYVRYWGEIFGQFGSSGERPSDASLNLATKLVREESTELINAVDEVIRTKSNDFSEVADGIGDTLWVTILLAEKLGIDSEELMRKVYESNMSRVCTTEEIADITIRAYETGEHWDKPGEIILAAKRQIGDYWLVFRRSDEKILKSIKYIPLDLSGYKNMFTEKGA